MVLLKMQEVSPKGWKEGRRAQATDPGVPQVQGTGEVDRQIRSVLLSELQGVRPQRVRGGACRGWGQEAVPCVQRDDEVRAGVQRVVLLHVQEVLSEAQQARAIVLNSWRPRSGFTSSCLVLG